MPTYTYACSACDERFEAVQSIHDDALTECVSCASSSVRRVIGKTSVGVTFKGSGFYRTDSRSGSSSSSSSSTSAGASPS